LNKRGCFITDLGLSRPVNKVNDSQIYGVLPYVAPEVLQGEPYTQAADIYSFGIVTYELFANTYPYANLELDDDDLALRVCRGLRPSIDELKIPTLLKNLIKKCWDADPLERPSAEELFRITHDWHYGSTNLISNLFQRRGENEFYHQYKSIKQEYNQFSQSTPYQIHSNAVIHSKPINTKQITQQLEKLSLSRQLGQDSGQINLVIPKTIMETKEIQEEPQEQSSFQALQEIPPKN